METIVLSGYVPGFEWALKNLDPSMDSENLAHLAANSGNPDMLHRVANWKPELITAKDGTDTSVGHFAAWSGCSGVLEWIQQYHPDVLSWRNRDGMNAAHCSFASHGTDAVIWVVQNRPDLLSVRTGEEGISVLHYAASQNESCRCCMRGIGKSFYFAAA